MVLEWENTTIGAMLARDGGSIKTGPFGTALKAAEYTPDGVPLISVGEIGYGSISVHKSTPKVSSAVLARLPIYILRAGDIVFARKGAVDRSAIVRKDQEGWFLGSDGIRLRLPGSSDPRFVGYYLRSLEARSWLFQHATGSTMPSLNQDVIERIPIRLPRLEEQLAISCVLGALDDKNELSRRMNETLEAMARAIFQDWFVAFGPTRAKMEGRPPYLAPDLWALFPDRLDAEGKPEGWEPGTLAAVIDLNPLERLPSGTMAPYLDMAALPIRGTETERPVMRPAGSGARFRNGDTLFARITPCLENGKTALVTCLPTGAVGWGSTEFIVMRPRAPVPAEYSYLLARDENFRANAIRAMTGTSGRQRVPVDGIRTYRLVDPGPAIFGAFGQMVAPLFDRITANSAEAETLAATRDLLLPRLMSGELRVKDAERAVEEVA